MESDLGNGAAGAERQDEVRALAARVAELERVVAELRGVREGIRAPVRVEARVEPVATAVVPPPPPMPVIPERVEPVVWRETPVVTARESSLEDRLGSQVFSWVGIVALIVGTSWALKLAFERGLVGPAGRVVIGLAAGVGLVVWSEMFRRKGLRAFSWSLKAVGSGVLYLSLWAGFQLYHLLPAGVALGAMVLVSAWNAFMAWSQDAELLAAYALVGGFATPLLLSTGGDHEGFLFTYLAAIHLGTVLLMRWKPWRRLLLPAYGVTAGYFIGWYSRFFHAGGAVGWDGQSGETALFVGVFFVLFALVSVRGWVIAGSGTGDVVVPVLLPLANAAFVSLALYSVMQDSGLHGELAWLMVVLAAVYLGLMRVQATAVAEAMHLAMAVVFLTIAIPLKASGEALTVAWLVEGLVLYWASTRVHAESGAPSRVLMVLSRIGYGLGLLALVFHWVTDDRVSGFFSPELGSAAVAIAALAGMGWLALEQGEEGIQSVWAALVGVELVAVLLVYAETFWLGVRGRVHPAFASVPFWDAVLGLVLIAATAYGAWWLAREKGEGYGSFLGMAGALLIGFNVVAVLCGVREIGALWAEHGSEVQRSLAVSAFLMAYGAGLLAAGFWRRSAFVRWQGLALLVFTILKVFLYDVSGLSQGYRVASFLGLGALLMAVSYAYQKDWLGLKADGVDEGSR